MLIKCDDSYIPQVKEYIGEDTWKCFYLYADMLEYRTVGADFGLWIHKKDDRIHAVAYRYYDTLHLYSRGQTINHEIISLIEELHPKCITGSQDIISQITAILRDAYTEELSHVITIDHLLGEKTRFSFMKASEADVPEIAEIMMEEEVYNHVYTYEDICRQMADGIRSGKRRVFIVRDRSGRLLASIGTYVETPEVVLIGGLIVNKKIKSIGLGPAITAYIWNLVFKEGKRGIALVSVNNHDSLVMSQKMGFTFMGSYARLLRN